MLAGFNKNRDHSVPHVATSKTNPQPSKLPFQAKPTDPKGRSTSLTGSNISQQVLKLYFTKSDLQNLARKQSQMPSSSVGFPNKAKPSCLNKTSADTKPQGAKKKVNLSLMMLNPLDDLKKSQKDEETTASNKERETINLDHSQLQPEIVQEQQQVASSLSVQDIHQTMQRLKQKIQSAQRKFNPEFGKNSKVGAISSFDTSSAAQVEIPMAFKEQHNSDQLIKTEDHSDIKHTQKALFDSTAQMTAKTSSSMGSSGLGGTSSAMLTATPAYEASQFTLNILGESTMKTPSQFQTKSSGGSFAQSKTRVSMIENQNTDEQGNRLSLLPSAKRPRVPSTKKKTACGSKKKQEISKFKESLGDNQQQENPTTSSTVPELSKNPLERMKEDVQVLKVTAQSKGIVKERTNFVKQNLIKCYKPRLRGAAFSNKIMAKKRNFLKNNERFKKKMQIENAKHRDQVNAYGGLGKVGLDHQDRAKQSDDEGKDEDEDLIPTFSASAMKYVKAALATPAEEVEEFLAEDLEAMAGELEQIDEEVKEESEFDEKNPNFNKALYSKIPQSDEEYLKILKERFGHNSFKEGQLEALKILLEKQENALVVLATGGGKSLVYQYASMFMPGLVLIITPLISLMTDQLQKLPDFLPGAALNSQQSYQMKKDIYQAIGDNKIKLLFISPERFFIEDFGKFGNQKIISMVCVDEIHCASEWSHNFRPTYLKIHDMIREKLGEAGDSSAGTQQPDKNRRKAVVLGLTATATKATQKSICDIFNVRYPEHRITQEDLSRINLQLSITRDHEKQKGLLSLLKSDSFKKLQSILIYATHKRTCELLASFLTQNGINSQAYHAGKTDAQRSVIQKCFNANQIRVLVCTIAFSMGIDKADIQSVIHYDMPKSIENYVQEIGRAGRDGKLARCHLFLNNEDFFLIRRLILTDLLDNYNSLKLTNKIIVEAKRQLIKRIKPELVLNTKKRKIKQISGNKGDGNGEEQITEFARILEEFEFEHEIKEYYSASEQEGVQKIDISQIQDTVEGCSGDHYVFLDVREQMQTLDLKREVVMTMLNSLEKLKDTKKRFFRFEGVLPGSVGVRFHKQKPHEMAEKSDFIKKYLSVSKEHQGVHRCSMQKLAYTLGISPFQIPKILYSMQNAEGGEMTYETDQECFVLKLSHIPYGGQTLDLSGEMLQETRRVEQNMVSKLNCMYFVARKVSLPNVDHMLKREKNEDGPAMYMGFSKQLNDLINMYFNIEIEQDMEIQIAGTKEERDIMLPLLRIETSRDKAEIESEIKKLLRDFHDQGQSIQDPNERMKPLDVVKIMMGIYSDRANIKRFMNNSKVWAKFQEYDNDEIYKVAQATVNQFYLDQVIGNSSSGSGNTTNSGGNSDMISGANSSKPVSKKRKLND